MSFWGEMFSSSDECTSECDYNIFSMITWSESFLLFAAILLNALHDNTHTQQTQHFLHLLSWFKHLHCLTCHILMFWQGMDWTVDLKIDISVQLLFTNNTKKSVQKNEGHLPLVPYCTNQCNEHGYAFFSSTLIAYDLIPSQHPDKPTLPWNINISIWNLISF